MITEALGRPFIVGEEEEEGREDREDPIRVREGGDSLPLLSSSTVIQYRNGTVIIQYRTITPQ